MNSRRTQGLRLVLNLLIMCVGLVVTGGASTRYEDGSLVLKMRPGYSVDGVVTALGASVRQQLTQLEIYLLGLPTSPDLDSLAAVVAGMTGVDFCQPNYLVDPLKGVQGSLPVSDQQRIGDFGNQVAFRHLNLGQVHTQSTGAGVRVAVLDGGVNYEHPVLEDRVILRRDYVDSDNDPFDEEGGANSGHGTFVAGVTRLVAPEAEIYAYRVMDREGVGNGYVLAEAVVQAVNDGCRVINLSLVMIEQHEAIRAAAAYAAQNDVLIVAAAGNGHAPTARYPASDPNVLGVAAVDTLNVLAGFSCYGAHVDICAPGADLYGPYLNDGYAWWGGTSFAAPFVAAQAALLWYYEPSATRLEIIDAILTTATDLDDLNPDLAGQLGSGLIDPLASIIMIRGGSLALRVPSEYPTIQAAIDASLPGDTVLIAPGEYAENVEIADNPGVILLGEMGAAQTVIRPASLGLPIINIDFAWSTSGIPEIAGLTFTGAVGLPAVAMDHGCAVIRDNIFRENHLYVNPGFLWKQVGPSLVYIRGYDNLRTDIKRNLFIHNGGECAIRLAFLYENGSAYIVNNTFYDNPRVVMDDRHHVGSPEYYDIHIYNNIISGCRFEAIGDDNDDEHIGMELAHIAHNLFWNNPAPWEAHAGYDSSLQVFADPVLANPELLDVRLLPGSAALDAGDPAPEYNDPDGSRNDIGVFPYQSLPMPFVKDLRIVSPHTLVPELRWTYVDDPPSTQQLYQIQVGIDPYWDVAEIWDSGPINGPDNDIFYSGPPLSNFMEYYFRVRLGDGGTWGDWYVISGRFKADGPIRVPSDLASIQQAIDMSLPGDTVLLEPGTYRESVTTECTGLVIRSTGGPAVTVLRSQAGASAAITLLSGDSLVSIAGLTFTDGTCGVNAITSARCEVRDCRFEDLSGNAVYGLATESMSVVHCEFRDNYRACAVYDGLYRFDSNYVTGSVQATQLSYGSGQARNNVFARNGQGLRTAQNGNVEVANNTIYGSESGGLIIECNGNYYNNLVVFNKGVGITVSDADALVRFNNAFGNFAGNRTGYTETSGGLSADPRIIDTTGQVFALRFDSPCIDAGDPDPSHNDPDGSRSDIGAVSGSPADYPIAAGIVFEPVNAYGVVKSGSPTVSWSYLDPASTAQNQYEAQIGVDPRWQAPPLWSSGSVVSSDKSFGYGGPPLEDHSIYFLRLRVHDGSDWGDWNQTVLRVSISGVQRVPDDQATISAAVAAAFEGDSVIVGPGTYTDSIDFAGKALVLTSRDGVESTIITFARSGQQHLVTLTSGEEAATTISNLTLRNMHGGAVKVQGSAAMVEGCVFTDCGRTPLFVTSPNDRVVARNNRFRNSCNNSTSGGGLRVENGTALVESNWFENLGRNGYGGAMALVSSRNCIVRGNLFTDNDADLGGAIWVSNAVNLKIHNNTFYGNKTTVRDTYSPNSYGGACLAIAQYYPTGGRDVDVRNNIFAFNGPGWAILSNIYVTCQYNDAYMNANGDYFNVTPGTGCISADPLFVDSAGNDFHLTAGSPCINAGDPSPEFVKEDGSIVDMGAFEYMLQQIMPLAQSVNLGEELQRRVMSLNPAFHWSYTDTLGSQQAYELQLTSYPPVWEAASVWTSGEVASSDPLGVYGGPALVRGTDYIARVRVGNGVAWGSWSYCVFHVNAGPSAPTCSFEAFPTVSRYISTVSLGAVDPEKDSVFFDFKFARDAAMTDIIMQVDHSASGLMRVNFLGELETAYYMQARATDGLITTPWVNDTIETLRPGGRIELIEPVGPEITCGQKVRFVLSFENDQSLPIYACINGFAVTSPDGAVFDPIVGKWALEGPVWDSTRAATSLFLEAEWHHPSADSIAFMGFILPRANYMVPPGVGGTVWYIETEIPCSEIGKLICFDKFDHQPGKSGYWDWYYGTPGALDDHTYPNWSGPHYFTINTCCDFVRGDVNNDGEECTIGDITALIDHLFISCPALECIDESNLNADPERQITIGDITFGVDHLFISQRDLIGCLENAMPAPTKASTEPTLWCSVSGDTTSLYLSTATPLRGLQLSLVGEGTATARKLSDLPLDLVQGRRGDTLRLGLVDLDGAELIDKGDWAIVTVPGVYRVVLAQAADRDHETVTLALKDGAPNLPTRFELSTNYPNPFNPITKIQFALPKSAPVRLTVFNILGQTVDVLVDRALPAGYHMVEWNADEFASGVYFYRLKAGDFEQTRKMMLIK